MFIKNLRMSILMEADTGGGSESNTSNVETKPCTQETTQEEKTFTLQKVD